MARVNLRDRTGLGNTERTSRVTGDRRRLPRRLRQPSRAMQVDDRRTTSPRERSRGASAPTLKHMVNPLMFSKIEADRILKRAAEIEGSEDPGPLTIDELRSIAGEAGFGSQAVERAIVEAQQAASTAVRHDPVQKSGLLIAHLWTIRAIPVEISSDQLMKAVRLFQPYRDGPVQVSLGERQITWQDRKGLRFTVTSEVGVTEVRVYVSKFFVRKRRWMKWVKSAADHLEALMFLVSNRPLLGAQELVAHLPGSNSSAAGPQAQRGEPTETR